MSDNYSIKSSKQLQIGNIRLENPFILAPMAGITDGPFRRICRQFGCGLVYSEMISAKGLYYNDASTEKLLKIYEDEKPLAYQIFGSDPDCMAMAVEKLESRENVIIDINMGCPVPKVVKNGDGSALMNEPGLAAEVIRAVVSRTNKPVTVKMRLGWTKDSINVLELAKIAEDAGASAIGIHARTRDQYYKGHADWDYIGKVKRAVAVPVIGSGDIFAGEDAMRMMTETGCDFVMIARGALGNPWIFGEALALWENRDLPPEPTIQDKRLIMKGQLDALMAEKGEYAAVREMRKHISWYMKGFHGAAEVRRSVNSLDKYAELVKLLDDLPTGE